MNVEKWLNKIDWNCAIKVIIIGKRKS